MSAGRSSKFWIAKVAFEMLLDELPGDREVGILGMTSASVEDVKRVLSQQDPQIVKLAVEVQDRDDYVVHLGAKDPRLGSDHVWTWLTVREYSPIYRHLRQHQIRRTRPRPAVRPRSWAR